MNDLSNSSNITKTNLPSMSSDNYRRSQETIIAQITSFAALGIITVLGNLASIITFAKTQSLRKRSNYTIINLSIADLLVSSAIFMACYYYLFEPAMIRPQYFNIAFDFVDSFTSAASMIALTMISVERFYAVVFPFKHMMLRFKHHLFLCLAPWLVAAATVLTYVGLDLPTLGHKNFVTHITVRYSILFLALIVIVVSYLGIWLKSRYANPSAQDQNRSMRDLKLSVTLFIVTLVSLSAWLPIQIFQIANFFSSNSTA